MYKDINPLDKLKTKKLIDKYKQLTKTNSALSNHLSYLSVDGSLPANLNDAEEKCEERSAYLNCLKRNIADMQEAHLKAEKN
jgi:hypothetical protein